MDRVIRALEQFFASYRFPLMVLCVLASVEVLLLAMLVVPAGQVGLGAFAEEFRVWCFGYDPATGRMQMGYVFMLFAQPLALGGVTLLVWHRPLRELLRKRPLGLLPYVGSALVVVAGAALLLVGMGSEARATELPFPAEELRLTQPAPEFELVDQDGKVVRFGELRGQVVVVSAVYASCRHTCPLIMAQAKRAIATLGAPQREKVAFLAVTLDPEHDDQDVLSALAVREGVSSPRYRFLTGRPEAVNEALDRLDISRKKDPETGVIAHANLFLLYDRTGKLAYRMTLGERQERWLVQALSILLAE